MQRYVKNVRLKNAHETGENRRSWPFCRKLRKAFRGAWGSLRSIMGYLLVSVALGAGIYGYMPQDFVLGIAGPDNPFAVPVRRIGDGKTPKMKNRKFPNDGATATSRGSVVFWPGANFYHRRIRSFTGSLVSNNIVPHLDATASRD